MPNPSELQREEEDVFWKTGTVQEFLGLSDEEMAEVEKRREAKKSKLQQVIDLNEAYAANLAEGFRLHQQWKELWPTLSKKDKEQAMELIKQRCEELKEG